MKRLPAGVIVLLCGLGACADSDGEAVAPVPTDAYVREVRAWVETPEVQALDPRTLERVESFSHAMEVSTSLLEATNRADAAALGTVERTRFWRDVTITRIRVERVAKGTVPDVVTVVQLAGLRPGGAFRDPTLRMFGAVLATDSTEQTLLAGDRAVLFLDEDEQFRADIGPAYRLQPRTSLRIGHGRTEPLEACPFFRDVEGDAAADVLDRIAAYAR